MGGKVPIIFLGNKFWKYFLFDQGHKASRHVIFFLFFLLSNKYFMKM